MRPGKALPEPSDRILGVTVKIQFGAFTLDQGRRQLLGAEGDIHLSPKAYELLKVLLEQRPKALSKAELHERLWPSTFVSDVNLGSKNGTWVKGQRVAAPVSLEDGDEVRLGTVTLVFRNLNAPGSTMTAASA